MQVYDENRQNVKEGLADVTNSCTSSHMGANNAAAFLQTFINEGVRYAHIDVAGYATGKDTATGSVVQTVLKYLTNLNPSTSLLL